MDSTKVKPKILFVTTGYPSIDHPNQSIFIHRSIKVLSILVDAHVIHLRAWLPGRPFFENWVFEGISITTIYCPQGPLGGMSHFNTQLLAWWGFYFARSYLNKADLVHSTDLYPGGFIGSKWASKIGLPHTSHAIGADVYRFLPKIFTKTNKFWLTHIHGVACTSQAILEQLIQIVPRFANLNVIYRGVNSELFTPEGIKNGPQNELPPVRFMYLGGFHSWNPSHPFYSKKGGHFLLEAWKNVETRIGQSSLLIGGPGCNFEKLELWRSGLKRPEAVFFLKAITPSRIPSLIRTCDVVVIPSDHEGLPNIANEAQACGRPVLGTDAGGIPETVIHGRTGRILPHGDPVALAEGLEWFFTHQNAIPTMGSEARKHMVEDFGTNQFSDKMMSLFEGAMEIYKARNDERP